MAEPLTKEKKLIAEKYLPLWKASIIKYAKKYPWLQEEISSEFALAFCTTCSNHDDSRNVKFSTRYYSRIQFVMIDILKDNYTQKTYKYSNTIVNNVELESVELKDELSKIDELLRYIPKIYRFPLVLHTYGELTFREVASLLCISQSTAAMRVHKARVRLKQLYKEVS